MKSFDVLKLAAGLLISYAILAISVYLLVKI